MRASRYIKCVTVGDVAVGKTCLLHSHTTDTFREKNVPTILDSLIQNVVVDGATVNLGLWDTAGHEDYKRLRPLGYHDADVFILAFSLVSKTSYDNVLKKWYPELKLNAPRVPIVLVGTKLDLRDDKQYFIDNPGVVPISHAQGDKLKELIGAPAYIECSSKTQQNVKAVFDAAIREVLQPPKSSQKALITYGRRKSDKPYYPIETVEGILLNLDPVSLVRFRQVCQGWKALISSERFIRAHLNKQFGCYRRQGLFLDSNRRIYSGDIDGLADGIYKIVETHLQPRIVGSATEGFVEFIGESNGLMCYKKIVRRRVHEDKLSFCIWNPSTNECMERLDSSAVSLVPNDQSIFGFGYDQSKDDYRIIHLYWHAELPELLHLKIRFVSTWNLRIFLMEVDPDRLSHMTRSPVVFVNGGFHCLMRKSELPDAQYSILSYSVDRVEFEQNIPVPSLRATKDTKYELSVVDGQMLFLARDAAAGYYEVWILKNEGEEPVWSLKIAVTKGAEEYDTIRPLCFTRRGGVVVLEDWDLKIFYKENVGRLVADDGGVLGPERAMGYLESLVSPYRMPNAEIQRYMPYREIETKKHTFDDLLEEEAFEKETRMEDFK